MILTLLCDKHFVCVYCDINLLLAFFLSVIEEVLLKTNSVLIAGVQLMVTMWKEIRPK